MLSMVEKVVGTALALVALYLLLANSSGVESLFRSLGGFSTGVLGTLQGRPVEGFDVKVGSVASGGAGGRLGGGIRNFIDRF